jgi:myo-inositol-1-phosphate synthase
MPSRKPADAARVGVWLIGALGDIATTLMVGTLAIRRGLREASGLTTARPPLSLLALPPLEHLSFGGIDIRAGSVPVTAEAVSRSSRTFDRDLLEAIAPDLAAINHDVVVDPQVAWDPRGPRADQPPLSALLARLRGYIHAFVARHDLDQVVVVDVSSAEPATPDSPAHLRLEAFNDLVARDRKELVTPSMLHACAAMLEGCAYVNFTANVGSGLPALQALAEERGVPHYGSDGKTGETLLKTALAPMFAYRNLRVLSWEGVNMLGNGDGKTLAEPANRVNKLRHKGNVLEAILGYPLHSGVRIDYVPSLGDWKTAWDLIHFEGFLGVRMSMQFTWQGCDSILAAPLVLDLVRLGAFAAAHGERGLMRHLACFFKSPVGVTEMALEPQYQMLVDYAERHLRGARQRSDQAG